MTYFKEIGYGVHQTGLEDGSVTGSSEHDVDDF